MRRPLAVHSRSPLGGCQPTSTAAPSGPSSAVPVPAELYNLPAAAPSLLVKPARVAIQQPCLEFRSRDGGPNSLNNLFPITDQQFPVTGECAGSAPIPTSIKAPRQTTQSPTPAPLHAELTRKSQTHRHIFHAIDSDASRRHRIDNVP
ncbi:hypothetical protein CSUB01_04278 [Colletotrichum sublineola]|uniref:Uncharacterized protein n=1 Tax=Colletotrichum sublineola TaxID=1173701 RepID=A0A066XNB3_COLSU|nr:hypothetical protein CSUB01_04278 [Colletotrichum sublineola]